MDISKSIFSLAKSNNGFFKSEKQSAFLISQLNQFDGFIGHSDSGYNSCPIFATWDEKGVLSIVKSTKNGDVVMFERKKEGVLTALETKYIKSLERKLKALKKQIEENQLIFDNGNYNNSGDKSTYTQANIDLFHICQGQKKTQCINIEEAINKTKNS